MDLEAYKVAYQRALADARKPQKKKNELVLIELDKITEEEQNEESVDPYENMGIKRNILMILFMSGNFFLNYDNGVIPAT